MSKLKVEDIQIDTTTFGNNTFASAIMMQTTTIDGELIIVMAMCDKEQKVLSWVGITPENLNKLINDTVKSSEN